MEIKIEDIPDFLKDSEFYESLSPDDNQKIQIPKFKIDDSVQNLHDFLELYKTLEFFIVKNYPDNFIEYYENNSQEVFDSEEKNENLFKYLCNLEIKNYKQLFVTYKIIKLYNLNPENYTNYINYSLNHYNQILEETELYKIDEEFRNFVDYLGSTYIFNFISIGNNNENFIIELKIKKLCEDWEDITILIRSTGIIECIKNLKDCVEKNEIYFHKFEKELFFNLMMLSGYVITNGGDYPKYENSKLTFLKLCKNDANTVTFKINEFNKLSLINQLDLLSKISI